MFTKLENGEEMGERMGLDVCRFRGLTPYVRGRALVRVLLHML